jgi:hypothetical protein
VLHGEGFVLELFAVDRLAASAISSREVATLAHEPENALEHGL